MPATYEPIATTTLGSAASTITFSSIGSGYTDLVLVTVGIADTGASGNIVLRFNSDTGTNYSATYVGGDGSSAFSARETSQSSMIQGTFNVGGSNPAIVISNIFNYAGSTYKTVLSHSPQDANGSGLVTSMVGLWRSTAAITSVTVKPLSGNFATGTTATLYGILKA